MMLASQRQFAASCINPIRSFSLKIDADNRQAKPITDPNTIHPSQRRDPAAVQAEIIKLREELKKREYARKNRGSTLQMLGIGAFALNEILSGVVVFGLLIAGGIYIFDVKSFQEAKAKLTSKISSQASTTTEASSNPQSTTQSITQSVSNDKQ